MRWGKASISTTHQILQLQAEAGSHGPLRRWITPQPDYYRRDSSPKQSLDQQQLVAGRRHTFPAAKVISEYPASLAPSPLRGFLSLSLYLRSPLAPASWI